MMKSAFFLLLLFIFPPLVHCGIKFPEGVFRMAQLDQAMEEAKKQKKPLFFVYSDDTRDNYPELLEDTLKAGADWTVPVYVSLREGLQMPPIIQAAVKGGYLPMIFISTPETDKVLKTILPPSNPIEAKELRKHVRAEINLSKPEIAAWFAAKPAHGPELPGDKKLLWPNLKRGLAEEGIFGRVENETLYFRDEPTTPNSAFLLQT